MIRVWLFTLRATWVLWEIARRRGAWSDFWFTENTGFLLRTDREGQGWKQGGSSGRVGTAVTLDWLGRLHCRWTGWRGVGGERKKRPGRHQGFWLESYKDEAVDWDGRAGFGWAGNQELNSGHVPFPVFTQFLELLWTKDRSQRKLHKCVLGPSNQTILLEENYGLPYSEQTVGGESSRDFCLTWKVSRDLQTFSARAGL